MSKREISPDVKPERSSRRLLSKYWPVIPISAVVIIAYIWFVSSGTWTQWDSATRYYTDLAKGFQLGQLSLARNVPARLLASPDPYNANTAGDIQFPLDLSYYRGKYYLAFGPVPALALVIIHLLTQQWLTDLHLAFLFACGLYLLEACLILSLWNRYFRTLPKWMLWTALGLAGFAGPITFMLDNGRSARVYEAAVAGGQLFLISGLLVILTSRDQRPSDRRLALASLLWALAIGARADLLLPVAFLVIAASAWLLAANDWSPRAFTRLIPAAVILACAGAILAWYDWARFGSPFETGYYYQLSTLHLQQNWGARFSLSYIPPNLYSYVIGPASVTHEFPYLHATYVRPPLFLFGRRTDFYASQWVTGVLWMFPFAVFGVVAVASAIARQARRPKVKSEGDAAQAHSLDWTTLILTCASAAALGLLLLYFWTAMRFVEDFLPALMILSILGFWEGYQILSKRPTGQRIYAITGGLLAMASIVTSVLLGMSALTARIPLEQLFPILK
ncbi:MAG TPA: hypothetical protein VMJ64_12305 [Anaerolineales bacterium]|nr:hypothetical protein [Anaerolineales bacterium]